MSLDASDEPGWPAAPTRLTLSDEPTGWKIMGPEERKRVGARIGGKRRWWLKRIRESRVR